MFRRNDHSESRQAAREASADRPAAETEAPPRIVLRFAIYTGVALALAAIVMIFLVRHFTTEQAERDATDRARYVSQFAVGSQLKPRDFAAPVGEQRTRKLDALFERLVLVDGTLLADLVSRDGVITYSTQHLRIGATIEQREDVRDVLNGMSVSRITTMTLERGAASAEREVFASLLPYGFDDQAEAGTFAIYQDYGPIASAAQGSFLPIAGVFEIVVIALTLGLVPALRRLTNRIRRQMDEIQRRAYFDNLTSLPNRALFDDRLAQALAIARRENNRVGVLLMDVNRFKEINEALGRQTGDDLLLEFGRRVTRALRETDSLARLGGDEFAVLMPNCSKKGMAEVSLRVENALRPPFVLSGLPLDVAVAAGAALAPEHGEQGDLLLQHAEIAMYQAKEKRTPYQLYDPATDASDADRLAFVAELRNAIDRDEFILHYQPKANMQTGAIHGVEALVRWQHPRHGLIGPNEFIPLAEHTGLIQPLSRLILNRVVSQSRAWLDAGYRLGTAVNLSMADLHNPELPTDVGALLVDADLPPELLELEITETMVMDDPFGVKRTLDLLSEMGVRLAIDDFGTGYSSLAYLKRLPVDELKIDKAFIIGMADEVADATIVRSTIDLAHNLGLDVVAEGVESEEVWRTLASYGCQYAQGFGIARPMSAEDVSDLLERTRAATAGEAVAAPTTRTAELSS